MAVASKQYDHDDVLLRAINHGPELCACAKGAGASWSLPWTPSKLSQHGNVVRRGVVPSVTGL